MNPELIPQDEADRWMEYWKRRIRDAKFYDGGRKE